MPAPNSNPPTFAASPQPELGGSAANNEQAIRIAGGGINQSVNMGLGTEITPSGGSPAVMSSDGGRAALAPVVVQHQSDVAGSTPVASAVTPVASVKMDASTETALKQAGGVTADEAKAAGVDLSQYTYDPSTSYFFPTNGTKSQQAQFASDNAAISSAFGNQNSLMVAQNASAISALQSIYADRISLQTKINEGEQAKTETMNMRAGTSRYAGGIANSILTQEEQDGLSRIASIQTELAGKITEANNALQAKEYTSFLDQRKAVDDLKAKYQDTLKDLQSRAQAAYKAQQDLVKQNKADVASISDEAAKNGASADRIAAINAATDKASAIAAAGDSLQTSSNPDVAGYLFYKSQATQNGQSPESFSAWKAAQDKETENKAYGTAFATARGKVAGEAAPVGQPGVTLPVSASSGPLAGVIFSVPAALAQTGSVKIAPNGVKYVDASGLSPSEKASLMKLAYNGGVNPIPVITDPGQSLDVSNIQDATLKLADMKKAFDGLAAGSAEARDTYYAAAITMAAKLQTDPNAAAADVYQDAALDILKAMSGTKGFRGGSSMVDSVKLTFPSKTDTQATVDQKIANMQSLMDDRLNGLVGTPSGSDQLIIDGANAQRTISDFVASTSSITVNGTATSTAAVVSGMLRVPGATPASVYQALKDRGIITK